MFKKEKDGKTNRNIKNSKKGGVYIGFSFFMHSNYHASNYFVFFRNQNTDYQF